MSRKVLSLLVVLTVLPLSELHAQDDAPVVSPWKFVTQSPSQHPAEPSNSLPFESTSGAAFIEAPTTSSMKFVSTKRTVPTTHYYQDGSNPSQAAELTENVAQQAQVQSPVEGNVQANIEAAAEEAQGADPQPSDDAFDAEDSESIIDDEAYESDESEDVSYELPDSLAIFEGMQAGDLNGSDEKMTRLLPVVVEETVKPGEEASDEKYKKLSFFATYDKGFAILPQNRKKTPFDMRINGWIQFRHHGFARDVDSWTDNAGVTRDVRNRNAFDIERARIYFKGTALDPRLTYFYHLDGDSDGRHTVDFFDYWWAWKFGERLKLQFGKRKVTAGRQWLLGARRTRFIDRPVANDFFRPDRTIGLFGSGKSQRFGKYEFMIGNGYRTSNLPNNITDDKFTYAATQYFDPWGDFGSQIVDYDNSQEPLLRFGHSFVYSPITSEALGNPTSETDFIRLTDGTRLNQTGALAPGVTVSGVDVFFYGVDLGFKFRGWSFNSEVFMRWLEDFESDGVLPDNRLMQHGFYFEGGRFLIAKKLDLNFRYSEVDGRYGEGTEVAAGVNWYPLESHKMKFSFDVTVLDGSPLNNTASDILVGDDGVLFRTQIQAEF